MRVLVVVASCRAAFVGSRRHGGVGGVVLAELGRRVGPRLSATSLLNSPASGSVIFVIRLFGVIVTIGVVVPVNDDV